MLRFAGHNFEPLPSGALYWRAEATLLVADLHLEKMSSFARAGQLLPPTIPVSPCAASRQICAAPVRSA
ncbi:hypothetical protein N8A98_05390 [Devosia neptuniae]|uniref:Uncharacterized protein n=1 Tax=Devosia neptuniae TaxID=191302 RepID=A0ABY6CEF1_9HYPH|nr:hypothetical protein [Devosia neptuniae]UXN70625.1 hypothetical protein N8A98_05390 [Devosia neptuniae]